VPIDGSPEGTLYLGTPTIQHSLDLGEGRARAGVAVILRNHIAHG